VGPGGRFVQSRVSVSAIFLLHGLIFATWVSRIPAAQSELHLSPGVLGLVLLATSAGSLVSMPVTGWFVARYGSRRVVRLASLLFCSALLPLPWARSAAALAAGLFLLGAGAGAQNVSMNSHAVAVEQGLKRPIMGSFHALFSLGAMIGSAAGGWVAGLGVPVSVHFTASGVLYGGAALLAASGLHETAPTSSAPALSLRFPRAVVGLGLLAFFILIVEGAMADWSAVYLRSIIGVEASHAALGYAAYSAAMVVGRLAGDRGVTMWGRKALVRAGSLMAGCGLLLTLLATSFGLVLAGFGVTGLGLSVITPNVFGSAGRAGNLAPGVGLAAVTTAGYIGFLSGPPLIGGLAEVLGLRLALLLLVISTGIGAALAGSVEK
jgi:MFS family permease